MKFSLIAAAAVALTIGAAAQAATIDSIYTPMGAGTWLAEFTITNDGTPASFAGFTIDFTNATGLTLVSSPSTWDSIVAQPDPSLPDDGFFDSFVINPADALAVGQSIGGFTVSFTYAAGVTPGALPFVINSASFEPLAFGTTTVTVVPEPATALTLALGLGLFGLRTLRNRNKTEVFA